MNLSGIRCSLSSCTLNIKEGWKCCACSKYFHEVCAIRIGSKIKQNNFGMVSVLACRDCPISKTIQKPIHTEAQSGSLDITATTSAALGRPMAIQQPPFFSAAASSGQANFILDARTMEFLNFFKQDLISSMREDLDVVNKRVDVVENTISKQADVIDNILERIAVLENSCSENSPAELSGIAIDNVVHEVKERDYRSSNIVICGLQDFKPKLTSHEDIAAVTAKDLQLAKEVLMKMSVEFTAIRMTFRLGVFNVSKSRPLKVVLNSSDMAKSILKNLRMAGLSKDIYIRSDQTPVQLQVLKELNLQKDMHNEENPRDKVTVKFVKGKAQLINESKKRKTQPFRSDGGEDDTSLPKRAQPQK